MDNATQDSALLMAILDASVDAIIVSDAKGQIVRTNGAANQMFQYEPDELIGQSVNALMPDSMAVLHDNFMSRYIKTGEKKIIDIGRDVEGLRKDDTTFPLHLSVGHAKIDDQAMFIAILHDLTERRATQSALSRSQRLDAINQMTGGISHDFNNLLTVIIGNLELLEMRGPTDVQTPLIKDALDAAELGADLTSRLMVFARKSNLKPAQVDLREVCQNTLSILKRTLGAGYRIRTDFADSVYDVIVDPVQLQSALMNLALNARDAMGGSGELLVSVANVSIDDTYMAQEVDILPGNYVRLSVSDDGDGMTSEEQKRAFEPFFTTKSDSNGTGLGLAMVYGFVRQSGGHITLYSEVGHGTSFGLYFPALLNPDHIAQHARQGDNDGIALPAGTGKKILIVEDNPKVQKLSIERIKSLGFDTVQASSADEAYQMLQDGLEVDLVFSDLVMPGDMTGYDLAAKIEVEFPHLKVLLTSGYASDVITGAMAHDKPYDILHKPYHMADLAKQLQSLLTGD